MFTHALVGEGTGILVIRRSPTSTVFSQQIVNAVPQLANLNLAIPFWFHCPQHAGGAVPHLPRSSIESLRLLSYRLEEFVLSASHTGLRQFFSPFDRDDFDPASDSFQPWPALRHLRVTGSFVYADHMSQTQQDCFNEGHLACVGRAARFMPKLESLWIHNQHRDAGEPYGELRFTFHTEPYGPKGDKPQGFCLSVENHMPSLTVVAIWRESLMLAQREALAVEVHLGPVYDMDEMYDAEGPPAEKNWESWDTLMSHPREEEAQKQMEVDSDGMNAEA